MHARSKEYARRGSVAVTVSMYMIVFVGMGALVLDIGLISVTKTELQVAADAAALAGTGTLLNDQRLMGSYELDALLALTRTVASDYAARNRVYGEVSSVGLNNTNLPDGDVVIGYLADPTDRTTPLDRSNPAQFNAVQVRVARDGVQNGSIVLGFAQILGFSSANVEGRAAAMFEDGVVGYKIVEPGDTAHLLPFALWDQPWLNLLADGPTVDNDNYTYDPDTGAVIAGSDGIPELNLYPGSGGGQLPPGNFGTVDIGSPNNSTADIARQIRYGVNEDDLEYFGGELMLDPDDGTLELNGDTGLSAGIKDDLAAIVGDPRAIPLFISVSGPGNNSQFIVIGFAGMRIMNVKLTGPMSSKEVIIQPAVAVDDSAIAAVGAGSSYYVYRPVTLCR